MAKESVRYRECDSMVGARSGDMVRTSRVLREEEVRAKDDEDDGMDRPR